MEENLIIDFTPTGLIPTKSLTPHIPISASEIIEGVRKFAPTLVICVSLSGRMFNKFEERSEALELEGISYIA